MAIPPYFGDKLSEYYEKKGNQERHVLQESSNSCTQVAHIPTEETQLWREVSMDLQSHSNKSKNEQEDTQTPTFPSPLLIEPYMQKTEHLLKEDCKNIAQHEKPHPETKASNPYSHGPSAKPSHAAYSSGEVSIPSQHQDTPSSPLVGSLTMHSHGEAATHSQNKQTSHSSSRFESPTQNKKSALNHKKEYENIDHQKQK